MRDLAAYAASNAAVVDMRYRIAPQRIRIGLDGQRRAAGESDTGVIARADIGIDAETLTHHALAFLGHPLQNGGHAPLSIQFALTFRDDDLRPLVLRRQSLAQRADALLHLVRMYRPHPFHSHAAHCALDRIPALAILYVRPRRGNVLAAGRRGITVVHDARDGIALIEPRFPNAAVKAVVPDPAVAHDRYRAFAPLTAAQGRGAGRAQSIAH